ncbi:MAG: hypothetical protein K2N22_06195, partial [Clostridia bacterium]|nr:hypothetical protein [Clostridia bacterium]
MKIKRGNLLTVILAMLCAVAIALGVGFMMPKNEINSARAASSTVTWIGSGCYQYHETGAPDNGWGRSTTLSMMSPSYSYGVCSFNGATATATASKTTTGSRQFVANYIKFRAEIIVPANTEYKVTYNGVMTMTETAPDGDYGYGGWMDFYAYGDVDNSAGMTFGYDRPAETGYSGTCALREHLTVTSLTTGNTQSKTANYTETYTNTDSTAKTFISHFGVYFADMPSTSNRYNYSGSLTMSENIEVTGVSIPTSTKTSDTYTGSQISFPITYDASNIDITSVTGKDFDNQAISSISTADIVGGVFSPILAGTYTVTFDINSTAISNGVQWGDATGGTGTRTLIFTVKRKSISVPTITNSPQTYDPLNGCDFNVSTDFDATTMKADTVPSPATNIAWNAASICFHATAAGTYNVKFQLKDTKNYVWDIGAGTPADQPATVKVEPKKLTIPTITAPQEYSGSALTFVLADFNAGTDIKVDSATGVGGNTVTGASGAAITDTTDTFEATKVGKYTVALSLRDTKNYAWSDGTNTAKNVEFEITQKELLSTPPVSSSVSGTGGAEWKFGDTVTITITDDRASGENINLLCYYDVAGGTSKSNTLTATTAGNVTTITMPTNIAVGNYTLTVELNGTTGDNANYKVTTNNTLNFEVTSGKIDPSTYGWIYTIDGAAGSTIVNNDKLPFKLKTGSTTDGVKYELSIQIPTSDASAVAVDTSKYVNGYQVRSGDSVNTYKTIVALKSTDPTFKFEVGGIMQSTCEVELNWEIEKGTFDLTNVKWEYSLDGATGWTEYDPSNPPQYN